MILKDSLSTMPWCWGCYVRDIFLICVVNVMKNCTQLMLMFMYLMCDPEQFFIQCAPEMPKH